MHQKVEEAIDEIDAALFSGDQFHDLDNLKELECYLIRWQKELASIKETHYPLSDI